MSVDEKKPQPKPPLECMVCGKLFPRGALDLARHQTALTLLHRVSDKKSSTFKYGCRHCGTFFTSEEHMSMHSRMSSCGKERSGFKVPDDECIVCGEPLPHGTNAAAEHEAQFPKHIYSNSKRLSLQYICIKCGLYFPSEEIVEQHSNESFCARFGKKRTASDRKHTPSKESTERAYEPSSKRPKPSPVAATQPAAPVDTTSGPQTVTRKAKKVGYKGSNAAAIQSLRRTKRVRALIPADRKTLYAICSLLADKEAMLKEPDPPSAENIIDRIQESKKPLIERLKEVLNHDC